MIFIKSNSRYIILSGGQYIQVNMFYMSAIIIALWDNRTISSKIFREDTYIMVINGNFLKQIYLEIFKCNIIIY